MEFWLKKSNSDKIMLPVNPESFAFTEKHNNTSVNVNSIGEVNLLGKRDLKTGTISSHFPKRDRNYANNSGRQAPYTYINKLLSWKSSGKEDYSKRYKELEKTLEDLKNKLLTLEVNEDLQSIEEVIQNIDKEMEEYLQTQSFNENRVEFLNQHLTKVTVNKDSFLLEFDLIGGAILTGKDFYLFVDNPRGNRQIRKGPL